MPARPRVVILGGGFAGLETAFLLRHRLHHDVSITLVSDKPNFLFRPNTIYIPFGTDVSSLEIPLSEPCSRQDIHLIQAQVRDIDPGSKRVYVDGSHTHYDKLVIATGASMRPGEIPGLREHASTIWTPQAMLGVRAAVERIVERGKAGTQTDVLFAVPPNNKCAGPLYELIFMLDTYLRWKNARSSVNLAWASFERTYIQAFGPKLHGVVTEEFEQRNITGYLEHVVTEINPNEACFKNGATLHFDELISFPPYVAAVDYKGLPADDRGFVRTEPDSRRVLGFPDIYAPGDTGDFPVKQAFLAFLQADATAEAIVSDITGKPAKTTFDPISMCVMEQFDKATFAQVPLRATGDPSRPVEVRSDMESEYKVGVSPLWRLGKKLLGVYLPMRFRAGEPFHAGAAWQMMDLGLKGMSGVLSE